MKIWMKVKLADTIKSYSKHPDYDYKCSIDVLAWDSMIEEGRSEHENPGRPDERGEVVSVIIGIVKGEHAEIRVQYEQEDYKTNLLIQRAVKEGMKLIKEKLDAYLGYEPLNR
ncbi:hypothetical protein EXW96_12555 [Paenibacillus sp. JMULE4]|uniref:hypothetical protein n=1 Tax=Paenibacillus sp. JMULE4 TaxID=2518342 RepID=UPI00157512E4|nr:hypothetical protein [Paenibacillus sp. JMULE4]NTZ18373.1 hypothetical protein [Paenibacillus sp. JMULE4]